MDWILKAVVWGFLGRPPSQDSAFGSCGGVFAASLIGRMHAYNEGSSKTDGSGVEVPSM